MSPANADIGKRKYADRSRESLEKELESLVAQLERQNEELTRCVDVEHSLRESEEKYRFLVENSRDIIWKIDTQRRWTFVSGNVEKILGYRPDEILGRLIWDFVAPEYHGIIHKNLEERLRGKELLPYEADIIAKDGHRVPFEILAASIVDKAGRTVGIQGISRDVAYRRQAEETLKKSYEELEMRVRARTSELTEANRRLQKEINERKMTEAALRASEQKFRAIFDQTYQFIGLLAVDGTLLDVNMAALEFIGAEKADVIGKPFWETPWWTYSRESQEKLRAGVTKAAKGEFVRFEATHRAADGSLHYIDFSLKPVVDGGGNVVMLIPEGRDITGRKLIEDSLRESEEKFRVLAETSAAAIFVYQGLRFISTNRAALEITGYSKDELLAMSILDIVHPDFKKLVYERSQARQRGEPAPTRYEFKVVRKGGDVRWIEIMAGRILYRGKPAGVATLFDITERKQAEEQASYLATYPVLNPNPILETSLAGVISYLNPAASRLFPDLCDAGLRHPMLEGLADIVSRFTAGGITSLTREVEVGGSSYMENILMLPEKALVRIYATDITERKRTEEALRMSEANLAESQEIAHLGSWNWDLTTDAISWSDELYRIYDVRKGEFQPSWGAILESTHPDDREAFRAAVSLAMRSLKLEVIEHRILKPDGSLRWIRAEGKVAYDRYGKPIRFFGTAQDITERKKAQDELENAKAQAELYLDLMSHDINNMNQVALGYLELADDVIRSGGALGEKNRELIEKPIASLNNSSRLIDKVMKLRKLKTKELRLERVDICAVLNRMKDRYSHIAGREVTINYVSPPQCLVVANELIDEIFINLIENSMKHSSPYTPLAIDVVQTTVCEDGREYFRISVEDNGPGIPDGVKEKLFARYYRGVTRAKGKGLGLYLVKTLVDDFHGKVWVEDRVAGDHTKGARFVVMLPAAGT